MKFRLSHLIVLVSVAAAPVQAGFWDSIKKGLGLKSGVVVEAAESTKPELNDDGIVWNAKTASLQAPNGTVIDSSTGLMWMRCAMGQTWKNDTCSGTAAEFTWNEAINLKHTFAGHQDWRLPTIRELQTLVELGVIQPSINTTIFPGTPSLYFWSSSPYAGDAGSAWYVSFSSGSVYYYSYRYLNFAVRLVRASQ